ncbi:deacetylase [Fibrobacter succinogenes]|uniref:deacetylase n=1 Tax=Fibrobacter succinogenes TaxID=833 RepID=UPI0013D551A5|nr:deacetylase [Fibrobacter succinogenes]
MHGSFFITIDTEADNQWDFDHEISTENAKFLPRFQELCEKYRFVPTWLTNYEMANDDFFYHCMKEKQDDGLCEIGMHLHAWNTPPDYLLKKIHRERDYLIEYPVEVMDAKVATMTELIEARFGRRPVSHRSGRWTTNQDYFKILKKYGYKVDCSVTPHVNWNQCLGATGVPGSDYSKYPEAPYYIYEDILEMPMTIRYMRMFALESPYSLRNICREMKRFVLGRKQWLRPDSLLQVKPMLKLIDCESQCNPYLMFMIHSSELMPGGSPNFRDEKSIEGLYMVIETLFEKIASLGYCGKKLCESNC